MATKGTTKMNIYEKLMLIQTELKAPKNQSAVDFKTGKTRYKYRSCEDILEAVKPLLAKYKCILRITDEIETSNGRFYIKAVATITDVETTEERNAVGDLIINSLSAQAYARETQENGRMDEAQITGAASSYARKYALNGLFLIDDTRDVDTNEYREEKQQEKQQEKQPQKKQETKTEKKPAAKQTKTKKEPEKQETSVDLATPHQIELMRGIVEQMGKTFDEEKAKKMAVTEASAFIEKYGEANNGKK